MKKALIALTLVLVILCCAVSACAEDEVKRDRMEISMRITASVNSGAAVKAGDTVQVALKVKNTSGADYASEIYLYDPAGKSAGKLPLLKNGESAE